MSYTVCNGCFFISIKYTDWLSNYKIANTGIQFWIIFRETNIKIFATGKQHINYNEFGEGLLLSNIFPVCLLYFFVTLGLELSTCLIC